MHVRLAADRRSVAELGGHHSHGHDDVLVAGVPGPRLPEVGQNGRRPEGAAPCPEILRGVWKAGDLLDVRVDLARVDVDPSPAFAVTEQPLTGGREEIDNEFREARLGD